MTTMIPSFERGVLGAIREGVAAEPVREWPEPSLQLGLDLLRRIRESAAGMRQALESELANGVEGRSFVRIYGPLLPVAVDHVAVVRTLVESLAAAQDPPSKSLLAELLLLEHENKAFRDLLVDALSRASQPRGPVDWQRVHAAEEALARGEVKPFSRQ